MIATFLVFSLVIYDRTVHLNLTCREVPLEILHIRSGIPKAPFRKREKLEADEFKTLLETGSLPAEESEETEAEKPAEETANDEVRETLNETAPETDEENSPETQSEDKE